MPSSSLSPRVFRPKLWALALTALFAGVTIHLGNWQASRAEYKIEQQRLLDEAMAAPTKDFAALVSDRAPDKGVAFRYRAVTISGEFDPQQILLLDNKIQDGKAGYGVLQLFRTTANNSLTHVLIDRGWIAADNDRTKLPQIDTPSGKVELGGRVNLPISRNPGTADNTQTGARINYVNIEEIGTRLGVPLEPYLIEQTSGAGYLNTPRAAPSANYQKNRAYQMQWYAFAALAVVIFCVLSFRKIDSTSDQHA